MSEATPEGLIRIGGAGRLAATINPLGAELWRLQTPDGLDLQWNGDPAVWSGRAPILFPIVGRLERDQYRLKGQNFPLEKHGFARRRKFEMVDRDVCRATFALRPDEATRAAYPFEFNLQIAFQITDDSLAVTATVANEGDDPMPFSFGFHPAMHWPLPFGEPRAVHRLLFERPEPEPVARIDADGLLARREPSPVVGRRLDLADDLFADDALFFIGLESRSLHYGADRGPQLRFDFAGFPDLGVWTKPGADYICIEPWQGFNDPVGFDGELTDKPGILLLAPGEVWTSTMTMTLELN